MKKLIIYYSFIIAITISIVGLLNASNLPELISAIIFTPIGLYFGLLVIPQRKRAIPIEIQAKPESDLVEVEELKEEDSKSYIDPERRKFLKIIASAGTSIFLLSIFTKKAQAAFFGSVPGPGTVAIKDTLGNKIDPAVKQPTDGYNITQLDDSTPAYYGFTDKDGNWFIMREEASGAYRYARGTSSFSTNWTNRASLSYDYFDSVF